MNKNLCAITAPMGWNSYDYYDTTVTAKDVRANADFMAKNLKQFGWEYVVVDIEWYSNDAGTLRQDYQYIPFGDDEMDEYGRYLPSPWRFELNDAHEGFKPLADYVHSLGLKFGIHIMRGIPRQAAHLHLPIKGTDFTAADAAEASSICGWNPDMYGVKDNEAGQAYYDSIIQMYADWGVDFIKCDDICDSWMYREPMYFYGWHETRMLRKAIDKCGRPIVLSLSPGPAHIDKAWHYEENANMWRITDDFWDKWDLLKNMFRRCEMWQDHVKPGCFPDCDMLPLGMLGKGFGHEHPTGLTKDEQCTMMALWCFFGSPLMLGCELTKLDEWTLSLITNKTLLGLLGTPKNLRKCRLLKFTNDIAIWVNEPVGAGSDRFLAAFNLSEEDMYAEDILSQADLKELIGVEVQELVDANIFQTEDKSVVRKHMVKTYRY